MRAYESVVLRFIVQQFWQKSFWHLVYRTAPVFDQRHRCNECHGPNLIEIFLLHEKFRVACREFR